jgi:hypothetical protein
MRELAKMAAWRSKCCFSRSFRVRCLHLAQRSQDDLQQTGLFCPASKRSRLAAFGASSCQNPASAPAVLKVVDTLPHQQLVLRDSDMSSPSPEHVPEMRGPLAADVIDVSLGLCRSQSRPACQSTAISILRPAQLVHGMSNNLSDLWMLIVCRDAEEALLHCGSGQLRHPVRHCHSRRRHVLGIGDCPALRPRNGAGVGVKLANQHITRRGCTKLARSAAISVSA